MTRAALSILIVDDDPDDRRDIRRMLLCGSDQRYQFTEAQLGANCLRLLLGPTARRFDCVLLDYHLPDLDAMEVLVALGGTRAGTPAPVVVLTGADRHATSRLLQSGAMDFLGKGALTAEGLTRAVSNAV